MRARTAIPLLLAVAAFPAGLFLGSGASSGEGPGQNGAPLLSETSVVGGERSTMRASAIRPAISTDRTAAADSRAADPAGIVPVDPVSQPGPQSGPRFTPVVAATTRIAPSVVSITVLSTRRTSSRSMFEEFFGMVPRRMERTVQGIGSGFAIDDDGTILTNEHVVSGADSLVVTDVNGKFYRAEVVGSDPITDIAVLKVESGAIPAAPIGTSSDLVVGEPAIALGNPFGFVLANAEATVTAGVISGVGRDILDSREGKLSADMIQTDAAINPGNSGGPLVNAEGSVIGVNSAILSQSGGSEGIGFAIPIDRARRIADELLQYGRIRRPWVGVESRTVESETTRFSLTEVRRVAPGSSADAAGLEVGDLLLTVNDRPITSPLDWDIGLLDAGVGSAVDVTYRREDRILSARLDIEELPSEQAERLEVVRGLELITVTPQIAVERGIEVESGALVTRLSGAASRVTGLREGDVIVGINRRPVESVEDAQGLFRALAGGSRIFVTYYRDGRYYSSWPFDIG
ncbi:MAG: trypsin-like peptidase domain-containing protein [marine benthic group bacterium]|nr:trypsin-like peptidase domain-containing protein [Gemmatimonadota bacterium]